MGMMWRRSMSISTRDSAMRRIRNSAYPRCTETAQNECPGWTGVPTAAFRTSYSRSLAGGDVGYIKLNGFSDKMIVGAAETLPAAATTSVAGWDFYEKGSAYGTQGLPVNSGPTLISSAPPSRT